MAILPRLLPLLLLLLAASSAALLAINAHSSCPGPLAIPCIPRSYSCHFRSALWACESAHPHAAPGAPAPADGAGPTPRLGVPLPQRGIGGTENRSAGDPQASGAPHRLRTRQRSAPETRLASSSALSRGRPLTRTWTLVNLGAALYVLFHERLLLTHRESSRDSCPRPANLSVGSPQSRGQPQTRGHRLLCGHPPRDLKTKVPLDSRPGKGQSLMHTGMPLAPAEPGGPPAHLTGLECPPVAGKAPSHSLPFRNMCAVACSPSRVPTLDALLSRRLPLTSTKRPLGAPQLGEPKSRFLAQFPPRTRGHLHMQLRAPCGPLPAAHQAACS